MLPHYASAEAEATNVDANLRTLSSITCLECVGKRMAMLYDEAHRYSTTVDDGRPILARLGRDSSHALVDGEIGPCLQFYVRGLSLALQQGNIRNNFECEGTVKSMLHSILRSSAAGDQEIGGCRTQLPRSSRVGCAYSSSSCITPV